MCEKSEDIKEEIKIKAMEKIEALKQSEDLSRFVEELENQNNF
jgi:hypothetical protein